MPTSMPCGARGRSAGLKYAAALPAPAAVAPLLKPPTLRVSPTSSKSGEAVATLAVESTATIARPRLALAANRQRVVRTVRGVDAVIARPGRGA